MKHLNFLSNLLSLSLGSPCTDVSLDRRLTVGSPSGRYCSGLMRLVFILAILLTIGVGNVWGADATVTLDFEGSGSFPNNASWTCGGSESTSYNHTTSGSKCAVFAVNGTAYITYGSSLTNVKSVTLYGYRASKNTTHPSFGVEKSTDGGKTWSEVVAPSTLTLTSKDTWYLKTITIPQAKIFTGLVRVKYTCGSNAQKFVDDITITYEGSSYTVTATRNNNSYGTVSVSGTTITASPSDCYQVISGTGGYTVTSGTASVSHTGTSNTLTVTPSTDCTVQVNFEKKTVNTYIDEIQDNGTTEECDTHDAPSLDDKTPATSGTCAQQHWHFVGWVPAAYKATPRGHITNAGTSVTADGTTYYAVWSKGDANIFDGSTGGTFKIYADVSGTPYYMKNTISSQSVQTSTTKAQGQDWTLTKVTVSSVDYWTISYVSSGTTYYLTGPSTNTADMPAIGTSAYNWKIASGTYGTWRLWSASPNGSGKNAYAYRALMMNSSYAFKNYCPSSSYYDVEIGSVEYSDSTAICCTALASINGSVSWSNAATAVVSWDNLDHVSSWTVKYKTHAAGAYTTWAGDQSTAAGRRSVTITGLTPCTNYDFQIIANPASGYCDKDQTIEDSQTHNWTVTKTGVTNVTAASLSAIPATTCSGFGPITITAADGYVLPAEITVSGASHTWNQATGALTISSVTGNVSITITPAEESCPDQYTFAYGATPDGDGKNITDATRLCFSQVAATTEYQITGFTIPTTTQYFWVGYNGYYYDNNIGPGGASNKGSERNQFKYLHVTALQGQTCSDSRTGESLQHAQAGAYGTLRIYSNYDDKNLYVGFVPAGYQMRMGSGESWTNIQLTQDGSVWTSDLMTLDAATIAKNYYINVWTGASYSSSDEGVAINNWTDGGSTISSMVFKTGADTWNTTSGLSAGMRGKFRTWTDNCANNGYCHFVPYYQLQYNPASTSGTGTGSMSPLPASPVSCEESAANRTVTVATSSFTAPQYKQFDHWNTAADNSGSNVSTGSYTLTSDVTLYAQWAYIPVTALTLNHNSLKKFVGESNVTLSVASVTPGTANPAVTWTSSDGTVASVTAAGVVSFLKAGTATITATSTVSGSITATCSVEVRSISSPTMQDEDGTPISGSGLSATWTLNTRTLAASEGTSKYKFKRWIVTNATPASTTNLSTTLGDPTGNVTVVAEFYKPRTVTKGTGTGTSTFTVSPTGEVKYGSSVTVTCAATDGYKNPWTLIVTPSDGATYDETGSTGSITISNITKNITVDLAYTDKGCTTHKGNGVDEGSSYSNVYGPVNDNWKYGARQILYTKSDLGLAAGKKGTIKSISFQYQYSTAISDKDKVKIYMANTNLTSLSKSNYVTSFTEVYSGSMNCSNGWNEIELDTDFDYNGVGNLLVVIEDYSGKYTGSSYAFYYHEATTGIQLYNTTDGSAYDITAASTWTGGTAVAYRPNTKFCIEEDDMVKATVNWYVNGSIEHTQTDYPGTAFDEIPTPVSGDCDGEKEFVGWYTDDYTHASIAPAFVNPTVIPEGGADYYAVFATVTPTNNYQQITSEGDLVAGAKYLIVGNSSTTYNALPVDAATSLISVSPSGTPLTISNPGATLIWTLEGSADAWKIKSTNNNKYLQISSGSLTFETSTSLTFSVGVSSNIFTFTSSAATGNKVLSYYHGGKPSQFNAFSGPNTVYVFKQVVTATNYATTCAETYDVARAGTPAGTVTGGTFTVSPSKQAAGKTVTLSATPDLGYAFGSWTVTKTESPYTDITSTNVAGNTLTMPAYGVTVNATFTPTPTLTATGGDLSSTTLPFGTSCEQDEGTDKTFVLNGYSLTNDVTLTIGGTDASMFSVKSPSSPIDKGTGRINDQTVTVTFTPTSTGAKTATLTISSTGASSIVLTLSGTAIKHYKVHYWNSGTDVHQESVLAGEDASATWDGVDDEDGCDTETYKYFVGWSKTNVGSIPTTTKPTIGETYTSLSSDVNYYAVWTNVNPNGWERYESATIAEGDYLFIQYYGSNYQALNNSISSNRMGANVATLSGGLITQPTQAVSYDWNDYIWHIAKPDPDKEEYTIYNADESKYIVSTGTASQVDFVASPSNGKELFTITYNSTTKKYVWTNKYNSTNSVNAVFRYGGSGFACYASTDHNLYLYYRAGGTAQYITNCCDKNVTLATNSPSHGSITFSPSGTIATCGADAATRQTTMTVTPDAGYYLSAWSTTGVTPASLSTDIAYGSTSNSGAQATTVTFTQNTTTGTYTANATFTAIPVSSLSLRAQQTGQSDKVGNDLTMNCYPKEGQTGGNDPLNHTLKVNFTEVLPANALDKDVDWSVRVKATGDADWTAVGFTGNALNTNSIIHTFNKSTGTLIIKATEGTAEIKITAHDGSGVTAKVTITVANVPMSSVSVSPTEMEVYAGQKKPVTVTFTPANATDRSYSAGSSYTYVNIQNKGASSFNIEGKTSVTDANHDETVTVTTTDGSKTATVDVTVKPLPKVMFVDNVHNESFANVIATVDDGGLTVTTTKSTPTHSDVSDPGASYNTCERWHLHLIGWIESTWADEHPNAGNDAIKSAGAGNYYAAGADIDLVTQNNKTFYAVWTKIE